MDRVIRQCRFINYISLFVRTVLCCVALLFTLVVYFTREDQNFPVKTSKRWSKFRLFFLLPRGFPQKFPNLLIDANGRVLLDPVRSIRNQAQSEVFHPSVIVIKKKNTKEKSRRKLILSYGRTDGRTDGRWLIQIDRTKGACTYLAEW